MKMRKLTIALMVAAVAVACTKSEDVANADIPAGYGVIRLAVSPDMGLTTRSGATTSRASDDDEYYFDEEWFLTKVDGVEYDSRAEFVDEEGKLSIPQANDLMLHIASTDSREEDFLWPMAEGDDGKIVKFHADSTVRVFNELWKQRYLLMGSYKIELAWGDAEYEGPVVASDPTKQAKPYFYGINPAVTVEPRTQAEIPMTVVLGNSIVRLEFSRTFEKYFENGGEFEITTWTDTDDSIATVADNESNAGAGSGNAGAEGSTDSNGTGEGTEGGNSGTTEPVPVPDSKFTIVFSKDIDEDTLLPEGKYLEGTPFFIKNGKNRRFEIAGWAVKQNPASSITGDTVRFRNVVDLTTQTIDGKKIQGIDVEASHADYYPKLYTYRLDVEANYVTVGVKLNAEPSDATYIVIPDLDEENDADSDVEINDDAKPDPEQPGGSTGGESGGTTGGESGGTTGGESGGTTGGESNSSTPQN